MPLRILQLPYSPYCQRHPKGSRNRGLPQSSPQKTYFPLPSHLYGIILPLLSMQHITKHCRLVSLNAAYTPSPVFSLIPLCQYFRLSSISPSSATVLPVISTLLSLILPPSPSPNSVPTPDTTTRPQQQMPHYGLKKSWKLIQKLIQQQSSLPGLLCPGNSRTKAYQCRKFFSISPAPKYAPALLPFHPSCN